MQDFLIVTDNTADLPDEYVKENGIGMLYLTCILDGEAYGREKKMPVKEFYTKMRSGAMPSTSQVNPEEAREEFERLLKVSRNILCIAFSSGLSGSAGSCMIAAKELMEEEPDCKICVVDTLAAALGEGLLVHHAVLKRKEGLSMEETAQWLEEHKLNMVHNVAADDLFHLYRGGRLSKAAAVLGTVVSIKPIIHINNEGRLVPVGKVRGRRKALIELVDSMQRQMGAWKNDTVCISHADCIEDAQFVADLIRERFGISDIWIHSIGMIIGSHTGPGTVAIFYLGDYR